MEVHQKTDRDAHSARKFASILNRERDRTDRTGQEFSMVVFEAGAGHRKSPFTLSLVNILTQRIRSTDDIGRLEDGRIAAILAHTPSDAARKFVDNVRQAFPGDTSPPDCEVFVYPSRWIAQDDEAHSQKQRSGNASRRKPEAPSSETQFSGAVAPNRVRPIEELESSYLQRIPFGKRVFDVLVSLSVMILLALPLLLVALFIRVVSPGPIFFRQERVGYLGRRFTLWKFRTMHVNADTTLHQNYLHDLINNEKAMAKLDDGKDGRIIPYGNLIRAAGIDELPQLVNVLRGEMSLIGPRPCLPYEAREYASWQLRRFDTVPGLTGLWQVSGKNRTTFKEMMRLDIRYARKRALPLDAMIFLKTVPAIIGQVMDRPSMAPLRAKWDAIVLRAIPVAFVLSMLNARRK